MSEPVTSISVNQGGGGAARSFQTRLLDAINRSLRSPLTRNGYALVASAAVTSALGVVFWVIAAHVITPTELGVGAVLISTMMTISNASQLNFGNLLNRFLPTAGGARLKLLGFAYGAATLAAALASTTFLFVADRALPELEGTINTSWIGILFVLGTVLWTVFALQDSVLAGLRQAVWVPLENSIYSVVKIIILLVFADFGIASTGLFSAWTLPLVPIVLAVNGIVLRYLLPAHRQAESEGNNSLAWGSLLRFFRWDYVGSLMITAAMGVAPILVLSICGPEASAGYHLSWMIAYSLYLVGRSMGISLLTESMVSAERLNALSAAAIVQTMLPLGTAAIAIAVGAPVVMSLFGAQYVADSSSLLSLLALSSIPWGLVTIFIAIARARAWMAAIVVSQGATLVLALGLAVVLLPRFGVNGIGMAWLLAHSTVAFGIGLSCLVRYGREPAMALLLQMASALAEFVDPFVPHHNPRTTLVDQQALRTAMTARTHESLRVGKSLASQSDITVNALDAMDPATGVLERVAMAKLATTDRGLASLLRGANMLEKLEQDSRFTNLGFAVPKVLGKVAGDGRLLVVEEALPGRDGRAVMNGRANVVSAFELTAEALVSLNDCTTVPVILDEAWMTDWIIQPIEALRGAAGGFLTKSRRHEALDLLLGQQQAFWLDRPWRLVLAHGDLSPGNLIFAPPEGDSAFAFSGIVDWAEARESAPLGLDACHLVLTTRMLERNQELGTIVRDLLASGRWRADEATFLRRATGDQIDWQDRDVAIRLVAFTWLQHISCNVAKSAKYTSSYLWQTANINWVLRGLPERQRPCEG